MKKNKKIIIIIVTVIIGISILLLMQKYTNPSAKYKDIINRMDNKETFNVMAIKSEDSDIYKIAKYYEDAYKLKFEYIKMDDSNTYYKEFIKRLNWQLAGTEEVIFAVIENGGAKTGSFGELSDNTLKNALIRSELISKEYEDIDYLIRESFKDYYKGDKEYSILYLDYGNPEANEYRKLLVKNKTRSYVMYVDDMEYFNDANPFGVRYDIDKDKLPVLLTIKNNKVIEKHKDITLKDFDKLLK